MKRSEQKRSMRDEIAETIEDLCGDICSHYEADDNERRAEAIKILVEAYKEL